MIIGAMQPHFMPGVGYFGLMNYVDNFIILDDVQFDKRSWQQRNFLCLDGKKKYLTVPVLSKNKFNQKIKEVEVNFQEKFVSKHLKIIKYNYQNKIFFNEIFPHIEKIYLKNHKLLIDLNIDLILFFKEYLNINTKLTFSSGLNCSLNKADRIDEICKKTNCNNYISTIGSKVYLEKLKNKNYKISYYQVNNLKYEGKSFDGLCLLDLIFNIGKKTRKYIEKNFQLNDKK